MRQWHVTAMIRVSDILVSGARHLLIAVAILATLTAAFGVHLHLAIAGHDQHTIGESCSVF